MPPIVAKPTFILTLTADMYKEAETLLEQANESRHHYQPTSKPLTLNDLFKNAIVEGMAIIRNDLAYSVYR